MSMRAAVPLVLLTLFSCAPLCGQSSNEGSVEGTVTDPAGAVVPGVTLHARNVSTSTAYDTTSDGEGHFHFLALFVGTYEITAEHTGFAALIYKDVVVTVGAKMNLSLTLRLASQTQRVEVNSETPLVEPARTHVATTVGERSIASLPVNGRNFIDFILLAPGVIRGPILTASGSGIPSFGGQRSLSVTLVDGAENTSVFSAPFVGSRPYQFSLEAVREFQVNTNSYSAELGHAGNGIVSVVTKSGSNDLHGSLFWYFRDKGLNATDLIRKLAGQPKEPLHVHQFGGALGGPILKNKLFFFADYDGQRHQFQNPTILNLPSGFKLSSDPTVAAFQQRALDYLTPRAAPYLQTADQDAYFGRLDWQITSTQLLSGRCNTQLSTSKNGTTVGSQTNSLENNGDSLSNSHALALSLTSINSSSMVNTARFHYLLGDDTNKANSANPQATVVEGNQTVLIVGRTIANPTRSFVRQFEWADTLSWSRNRHVFKLGANVLLARNRWEHAPFFSGSFRLNSLESFGRSLAGVPVPQAGENFIQAFSGEGKPGATTYPNSTEFAGFLGDEWRVRPNLTLSLGLRYDTQRMAKPPLRNPSPALAAAELDTSFVPLDANNFAPRLGFAWTPLSSERLVVRGGYGLFYARLRAAVAVRTHYQNGVSVETRTFAGAAIPAYPNNLCGPPDPSGISPSCPPPTPGSDTIMLFSPDYVQPYDQHASLGFEFQLQNNWAISASYLMVKGTHLDRWRDINLPAPTPTNIGIAGTTTVLTYQRFTAPRPVSGFDRVFLLKSDANSIYHGLAVQLSKRFSHNFQFLAAYTLGRVIDDRPESLVFNPGGANDALLLYDSSNPRADRGPGIEDARHRFVLSGIWDLKYGSRLRGAAKAVLDGWEMSGILAVQSGLPYSGMVGPNLDLNNDGNLVNDRAPGQPRNAFRLPTTVSLDPRLTRNVAIRERMRLQLIWEAFNVFNRVNITDVRARQYSRSTSTTVCGVAGTPCLVPQTTGSTAFSSPFATSGPRIMQLAAKLLF